MRFPVRIISLCRCDFVKVIINPRKGFKLKRFFGLQIVRGAEYENTSMLYFLQCSHFTDNSKTLLNSVALIKIFIEHLNMEDYWADLVVHLRPLKSSMPKEVRKVLRV